MNKSKGLFAVILGVTMVTGCLSLEQRLTSSDPTVVSEAIREIYGYHGTSRLEQAVNQITNESAIIKLVQDESFVVYFDAGIRKKILDKLYNQDYLAKYVVDRCRRHDFGNWSNRVDEDVIYAYNKISDQKVLAQLATNYYHKSPVFSTDVCKKIVDDELLLKVAQDAHGGGISLYAIKRIPNKEKVLPLVFAGEPIVDANVDRPIVYGVPLYLKKTSQELSDLHKKAGDEYLHVSSFDKMCDDALKALCERRCGEALKQEYELDVAELNAKLKKAKDIEERKKIKEELKRMKLGNEYKAIEDKLEYLIYGCDTPSGRNPLLFDAFLANCKDIDILIKMVKQYGDKMSLEQCLRLYKFTNSAELKALLDGLITDSKIASEVHLLHPLDCVDLLERIKDQKMRRDIAIKTLNRMGHKKGENENEENENDYYIYHEHKPDYTSFISGWKGRAFTREAVKMFFDCLSSTDLLEFVENGSVNGYKFSDYERRSFFYNLSSEAKLIAFANAMRKVDEWYEDGNEYALNGYKLLQERIEPADIPDDQNKLIEFVKLCNGLALQPSLVEVIANKATSVDAIESFLSSDFASKHRNDSDKIAVIKTMMGKVTSISDSEKQRILASAKTKLDNHIAKGGFALGSFYLGMPVYEAIVVAESLGLQHGYDKKFEIKFNWSCGADEIMKDWKNKLVVSDLTFSAIGAAKLLDCADTLVLQQAIKKYVKHEDGKVESFEYIGEIKTNVEERKSFFGDRTYFDYYDSYTDVNYGIKLLRDNKSGNLMVWPID